MGVEWGGGGGCIHYIYIYDPSSKMGKETQGWIIYLKFVTHTIITRTKMRNLDAYFLQGGRDHGQDADGSLACVANFMMSSLR